MKTIQLLLGTSVLALLLLLGGACSTSTQSAVIASSPAPPPGPTPPPAPDDHAAQQAKEDKVPRIKPAEAIRQVTAGDAILVDVRELSSYETMHAKGAIHVSFQDISEGKHDKLPKNKHLIFYCT